MLLWLVFAIQSSGANAAVKGYDLDIHLKVNDAEVASPRLLVKPGERARLTQLNGGESTAWEVSAVEDEGSRIRVKFVISHTDSVGRQAIVSQPQMIVVENEPAELTLSEPGRQKMTLMVLAKRKTL